MVYLLLQNPYEVEITFLRRVQVYSEPGLEYSGRLRASDEDEARGAKSW